MSKDKEMKKGIYDKAFSRFATYLSIQNQINIGVNFHEDDKIEDLCAKLGDNYHDLNVGWVFTGTGAMLKGSVDMSFSDQVKFFKMALRLVGLNAEDKEVMLMICVYERLGLIGGDFSLQDASETIEYVEGIIELERVAGWGFVDQDVSNDLEKEEKE